MTPDQLVQYYLGLLVMEYYGLPKATGLLSAFVNQAVASMIVLQVRAAFNLQTATGKQLDCLGQLVGAQRAVPGYTPGVSNFSLPRYSDVNAGNYIGLTRYGSTPSGHWRRYSDLVTAYIMADGVFAQFIQFLVAVRASDYSVEDLDAIFFEFFGNYVTITDNGNMTVTYHHNPADPGVLWGVLNYLGLLPHPAGVGVIVT